jgi:hypothetical protein
MKHPQNTKFLQATHSAVMVKAVDSTLTRRRARTISSVLEVQVLVLTAHLASTLTMPPNSVIGLATPTVT